MRAIVASAVALLSLISFACAEKPKTQGTPQVTLEPQASLPKEGAPQTVAGQTSNPETAAPAFPKGARWTIFCTRIGGDLHVKQANDLKNQLIAVTPMKNWYVLHEADQSLLYYGFYKTISRDEDKKEADRAQSDISEVKGMFDKYQNRPFERAQWTPLNAPDPDAPPEWNLANAKGYWTIQIGAYKDSPERKQAAVDAVRGLRQIGEQAYYYHGETVSSVCVGAWPKEAIKAQESDVAAANDPNERVMVSTVPFPEQMTRNMRDENGQKIKYLEAKIEIADPTMAAAKRKYQNHAVNGYDVPHKGHDRTGKEVIVFDPSVIMVIPQPAPSELNKKNLAGAQPGVRPPLPDAPSVGSKLKSIGE